MLKTIVLFSFLFFIACDDTENTAASTTGGMASNAGTQGGEAGTQGGEAGTQGGEAGTQGGESGTQGGEAGTQGGEAGTQGGEAGTQGGEAIEWIDGDLEAFKNILVGSYTDESGASHIVTDQNWTITYVGTQPSVFDFARISIENHIILAQNAPANEYFPGLWSRFDWYINESQELFFCQIAYDAQTIDQAQQLSFPDSSNLDTGCNQFPWSKLIKTE